MSYFPVARTITAITNAQNATVTLSEAHGYLVGQLVSFRVSKNYGMFQINEKMAEVKSTPSTTQITVNIDTSDWDSFVVPASTGEADPQTLPIGSGIIKESGIFKTNLNCSFDNRP